MCEHEAIRDANDRTIIVQMETQGEQNRTTSRAALLKELPIQFPARICKKCRSIFVPTTVSQSFELKGSLEGHLTR